jgi:diguanylate cyclase (GGDEF)-like protein
MLPPLFSKLRLSTQLTLVFGSLMALMVVSLSFLYGNMLQKQSQQEAAQALNVVASNISTRLAQDLYERNREVQVLAKSQDLWRTGLGADAVRQALERSQAARPNGVWIGVADMDGVVRNDTNQILLGENVKERPWFKQGKNGPFVGDVHYALLLASKLPSPSDGEPLRLVDYAAPVDLDGKRIGVLCIHGSWEWVREVIGSMLPVNTGRHNLNAFIFDRTGTAIYAPPDRSALQANQAKVAPSYPGLTATDPGPAKTTVQTWQDGQPYLTATVHMKALDPVADLGWTIVVRQSEHEAFFMARQEAGKALLMGLVAALLASVLVWLAATRLSHDLGAITHAAQAIKVNHRGSLPLFGSSRELSALSASLLDMTLSLFAAQDQLETKVKQRTAELEVANEALSQLAQTDPLTGLLNRRGFDELSQLLLTAARRSNQPLSVMMVDVDHFKRVNDSLGHEVGDEVLKYLASALRERLRASDLVARYGGEEFMALLPNTNEAGAHQIADALVRSIANDHSNVFGSITVSMGVATIQANTSDLASLLRRADAALYQAKGSGRNQVCAAPGPNLPPAQG